MFDGCTNLISPPLFNAVQLDYGACTDMFANCTSLTATVPLCATNLNNSHQYEGMFAGCTSLKETGQLPASTVSENSYDRMFEGCINLSTGPSVLPAVNVQAYSYNEMFKGCTNLQKAPLISATNLTVYESFSNMFQECTKLNEIDVNFQNTSWENTQTNDWLKDVASAGTFYKYSCLPVETRRFKNSRKLGCY